MPTSSNNGSKWEHFDRNGSIFENAPVNSMAQQSPEVEKVLDSGSIGSNNEGARQKDESLFDEHNVRRPLLLPSSKGFSGRRTLCANRDLMELAGVLRGIHSRMIREGYQFKDGVITKI